MDTFIDESGTFANPGGKSHAPCCLGALVLRSRRVGAVLLRFEELKARWGCRGTEVKGKDLSEAQVAQVLGMLREFDALAFITMADLGLESADAIAAHKQAQAENLTANLTREHKPRLVEEVVRNQATLRSMSNPLYIQFNLVTQLVWGAFQLGTLFHSLRHPVELGSFRWSLDAKDREVTEYERLWRSSVNPFLQDVSLKRPFWTLREGDYSHFAKFEGTLDSIPDHLRAAKPHRVGEFNYVHAREILADLTFVDSRSASGVQLADIVVTTARRALSGTMQEPGWRSLGPLLVRQPNGAVQISTFSAAATTAAPNVPYGQIIGRWNHDARAIC